MKIKIMLLTAMCFALSLSVTPTVFAESFTEAKTVGQSLKEKGFSEFEIKQIRIVLKENPEATVRVYTKTDEAHSSIIAEIEKGTDEKFVTSNTVKNVAGCEHRYKETAEIVEIVPVESNGKSKLAIFNVKQLTCNINKDVVKDIHTFSKFADK